MRIRGINLSEEDVARIRSAEPLSGTAAREVLRECFTARAEALAARGVQPTLAMVRVEGDAASESYAKSTVKECERCGIFGRIVTLPEQAGQHQLLDSLSRLNGDVSAHGVILLGPLPKGPAADPYQEAAAKARISPSKDLDALSPENTAAFYLKGGSPRFYPPTIGGALLALDLYGIDVRGARAAVMGRGNLVGRPMGIALMDEYDCTVTYLHTRSKEPSKVLFAAEVIVGATGKPHILGADDVPHGAILLDMGVHFRDGKTVGEFTPEAYRKARVALKTPGGSGVMTVCYLMHNCLLAAESR